MYPFSMIEPFASKRFDKTANVTAEELFAAPSSNGRLIVLTRIVIWNDESPKLTVSFASGATVIGPKIYLSANDGYDSGPIRILGVHNANINWTTVLETTSNNYGIYVEGMRS